SKEMLAIAREGTPEGRFVLGDMRRFSLGKKVDAVMIVGRSVSYMTTNGDVQAALEAFHKALKPGGILVFDNFNATAMFMNFGKRIKQAIRSGERRFERLSVCTPNRQTGWTFDWDATYWVDGKRAFRDKSVLRCFTPDEIRLFLALAGFETLAV